MSDATGIDDWVSPPTPVAKSAEGPDDWVSPEGSVAPSPAHKDTFTQQLLHEGVGPAISSIPQRFSDWRNDTANETHIETPQGRQPSWSQEGMQQLYRQSHGGQDPDLSNMEGVRSYNQWRLNDQAAKAATASNPLFGFSPGEGLARAALPGRDIAPTGIVPALEADSAATSLASNRTNASDTVARRLTQDLQGSGQSAQDIMDKLIAARAAGKPMTLADVGGKNIERLAGNVYRKPGEAANEMQQFFQERQAGAEDRLTSDVEQHIASGSGRQTTKELIAARTAAAQPAYEKAFEGGSTAPLQEQLETEFAKASSDEASARKALSGAQGRSTLADAQVSRAGNDVYGTSSANAAKGAATKGIDQAQKDLTAAQQNKAQILDKLRQSQDDASANAPGAVWNPRIQQFIDDPIFKKGLSRGLEVQRLENLAEGKPFDPTEYAITGRDENGDPMVASVPNMRTLDAGKKGLDAIIQDERDPITGRLTQRGRAVEMVRQRYLGELDSINPYYKDARDAWAGPSASMDAIRWGRTLFNRNPEEIGEDFGKLSSANKDFARLGVADAVKEGISDKGANAPQIKALVKTPSGGRNKIRPLFDSDQDFNRFMDSVVSESIMDKTGNKIMSGSQTAERGAEDEYGKLSAGLAAARSAVHAAHGNWMSAANNFLQAKRDLGLRNNPQLNLEISRLLMDPTLELKSLPNYPAIESGGGGKNKP